MPRLSDKKTARIIGLLFILATVMGVMNAIILGPLILTSDYLAGMSQNASMVRVSTFLNVIMAGSVVAIAVAIFPILKRTSETLAIAYLAARIVEGTVLAIVGMAWLGLVSLGDAFLLGGAPEASHFQTLGDLLVFASTSTFTLGAEIVFGLSAVVLSYALFKANLVPKLLSIWGGIGGVLLFALGAMKILGIPVSTIEVAFTVPIALNEMVLAVWLIFKGFND